MAQGVTFRARYSSRGMEQELTTGNALELGFIEVAAMVGRMQASVICPAMQVPAIESWWAEQFCGACDTNNRVATTGEPDGKSTCVLWSGSPPLRW